MGSSDIPIVQVLTTTRAETDLLRQILANESTPIP